MRVGRQSTQSTSLCILGLSIGRIDCSPLQNCLSLFWNNQLILWQENSFAAIVVVLTKLTDKEGSAGAAIGTQLRFSWYFLIAFHFVISYH